MMHYWIIKAFSRKILFKGSFLTMQWSQQSHMSSAWIAQVGLWITTALSHELLLNEWLMFEYGFITTLSCDLLNVWLISDYGLITAFSSKSILNGPCYIMESAKHSHVNPSWKAHVELRNHHSILAWISPEELMLYNGSTQHYRVNSPWIVHVGLRNHQNILT